MNDFSKQIIESFLPSFLQLPVRYGYHKLRGALDPEMFLVELLLKKRRKFVDIGANIGIYSYYFFRKFNSIDAFEPLVEITHRLNPFSSKVTIHPNALSSKEGKLNFYIPFHKGRLAYALASLEPRKSLCENRVVSVKKLDDFNFEDVDLIKIDVEGHESEVIKGAEKTIKRTMPILLVEIEQRHISRPIYETFRLITSLGYDGFFMEGDELISINKFQYELHQEPFLNDVSNFQYVNNFLFIPQGY